MHLPCDKLCLHPSRTQYSARSCASIAVACTQVFCLGIHRVLKGKTCLATIPTIRITRQTLLYWGRHLWSRGYCVSTVGLDEDKIRKYVKWQEDQEKQAEQLQ